jgi:excisionase family DNA binding protein
LAPPDFSLIFSLQADFAAGSCMDTDVMTIREVAEYLKLTEKTAYRLAADGKIPGFKVGGSWRFKRSELEKWIERQSTEQKTAGGE